MNQLLHTFREHPAVAGISVFVLVSLFLAVFFGTLMHRAGMSLRPLIFFFGFLAIVAGPQGAVHLLDALAHRRALAPVESARSPDTPAATDGTAPVAGGLRPVAWEIVFGPEADPALITDARPGLDAILHAAEEAKISFNTAGESALAARFPTVLDAQRALDKYGTFFQFAQVTGGEEVGWTAKRYGRQGEWNHVVTAGNELYAWSGATRESVESNRVRALGPLPETAAGRSEQTSRATGPGKTEVSTRLSKNTPVMSAFLAINLVFAVGWFFKASAWSARVAPVSGEEVVDAAILRKRLLDVNQFTTPVAVTAGADGRTVEITWRYADARWFDLMRAHKLRRTHKLVLALDEAEHKVRVREFWSEFDASAGADGLRLDWKAATGMQFFHVDHKRVLGVQLDGDGKPTGELSTAYTFNLQELKAPIIEAVTAAGWTWQPVMWNAPGSLRWLAE